MDIEVRDTEPLIVAFVMKSTNRTLATRSFELTPDGIRVHCQCEKLACPVNGYFYRPAHVDDLPRQIQRMIQEFQKEYLVPAKKVKFLYKQYNQLREDKRLVLPKFWLDPAKLAEARRGFDALSG